MNQDDMPNEHTGDKLMDSPILAESRPWTD